jgi:imidazolonepropionase-like amidohydrolase
VGELAGRTAIVCGALVDVVAGEIRRNQTILIEGERIVAVGNDLEVPDGTPTIDLSRHTVAPGLIDCHTHLVGIAGCGDYAQELKFSEAQAAFAGIPNALATLKAGFTTVRDVGTFRAFVDLALRDAINAGDVVGPRMACAGAYVTVSGGGGALTGFAPDIELPRTFRAGEANTVDEVRQRVREIMFRGADLIKVIATGAVMANGTQPGAPEFQEAEIRAAVEEAAWYGGHVAAHAHGAEGIKRAVRAGVRSIEHACFLDDEGVELMVQHGTYLSADIWWADWISEQGADGGWDAEQLRKNDETALAQRESFARAAKAGVKMAFGSDAGGFPHGLQTKQLQTMTEWGLTPMQAVQAATINSAHLIGWADRVGSIEPGKFADLVAVPGTDIDDLRAFEQVGFVMKGGTVIVGAG